MGAQTLLELMRQADSLSVDERLALVTHLVESVRQMQRVAPRKWCEARGIAPYPLLGEDAQAWVSRTRREADQRSTQWEKAR